MPAEPALLETLGAGTRSSLRLPVSTMPDGETVHLPVNVQTGRRPGPVLVAVAGHHGDEHDGPAALAGLWERLAGHDLAGTLVVVPVLNPPAFRAGARRGADDGLDLNRVFPGRSDGTVTERIAHVFVNQVLGGADLVLSMHGLSSGYQVQPYVECPASGPTSGAAGAAARALGLGFVNPFEPGEGRLMTHAMRSGVPLVEVEIGGCGCSLPEGRALYEEATLRLLMHLEMLDLHLERAVESVIEMRRVDCSAPVGGLLRPAVRVGQRVDAGQELAVIFDLNLGRQASIVAPCSGVVGILRAAASLLPGQLVATVFESLEDAA